MAVAVAVAVAGAGALALAGAGDRVGEVGALVECGCECGCDLRKGSSLSSSRDPVVVAAEVAEEGEVTLVLDLRKGSKASILSPSKRDALPC